MISQPMFFPWVGLFEQIRLADCYVHYSDVPFPRRSLVNRVQVKTAGGIAWMTVPLLHRKQGQPICEVQIDYGQNWQRKHRTMLEQAYAKAPFRTDMLDVVESVYCERHPTLDRLLIASINAVCDYLDLRGTRRVLDIRDLHIGGSSSRRILDTVLALGGTTYTTGLGARHYLDHELFEQSNVRVDYMDYRKTPYPQLHGEFTPFVSILDLIANTGSESGGYINSRSVYWKDYLDRE